jgi:hypothetical protein
MRKRIPEDVDQSDALVILVLILVRDYTHALQKRVSVLEERHERAKAVRY